MKHLRTTGDHKYIDLKKEELTSRPYILLEGREEVGSKD